MHFGKGPHAARALTVFPTSPKLAVSPPQFRVVLLRRLRLPLPVDHRAACAKPGVLASRALPLERASRVCQEAGARVARNVRLADMNIDVPVSDDRRIEVVAKSGLLVTRDGKRTPSLCAPVAAAWWSLASRSAADSARKPPRGYDCSQATGHLRPRCHAACGAVRVGRAVVRPPRGCSAKRLRRLPPRAPSGRGV